MQFLNVAESRCQSELCYADFAYFQLSVVKTCYIDEHLDLVDSLSKDQEAVETRDVQNILHACSGLTYYQHHTLLLESVAMVFVLELVQTYWSIDVTELRFEQPA